MGQKVQCVDTVNYAKRNEQIRRHHVRYKQFIDTMPRKLVCQECRGSGEFHESILDYGEGPDYPCGFCEGTGFVTPHMRGQWLRWKRNGEL